MREQIADRIDELEIRANKVMSGMDTDMYSPTDVRPIVYELRALRYTLLLFATEKARKEPS